MLRWLQNHRKAELERQRESWAKVYKTKSPDAVRWFQEHAARSLETIRTIGVASKRFTVNEKSSHLVADQMSWSNE